MRKLLITGLCLWSVIARAQDARTIRIMDLQKILGQQSNDIQVINFWATWCAPCIKELPYFETLTSEALPNVRVTLVSMDLNLDPNPEKVYRFIAKKHIQSEVMLLDERDPNSWIKMIDKGWSGALPATLLINHQTGKRKFIGNALGEGELQKYVTEIR
jgi:thiol-disulfide isomerase/thioredoxin